VLLLQRAAATSKPGQAHTTVKAEARRCWAAAAPTHHLTLCLALVTVNAGRLAGSGAAGSPPAGQPHAWSPQTPTNETDTNTHTYAHLGTSTLPSSRHTSAVTAANGMDDKSACVQVTSSTAHNCHCLLYRVTHKPNRTSASEILPPSCVC